MQRPRRRRRRDYDDDDDRDDYNRERGGRGWRCPFCRERSEMVQRSKISTGGWVTFAVLLFLCLPLFWIGLLIREPYNACASCGSKLGG